MEKVFEYYVNNLSYESDLPDFWNHNTKDFSKEKTLYDFQQNALKNALIGLWLYYYEDKDPKANAQFTLYKESVLEKNLDLKLTDKDESKTVKYYLDDIDPYPIVDNKISFEHFINRMGFWMATGSGKTLVIVKLIEVLGKLIQDKEIPKRDILFLTHRQDLIDQFTRHLHEFNADNQDVRLNLYNLREYDYRQNNPSIKLSKYEVDVYYYKSDLFSDETKENQINYKTYSHNGNWYLILDEAHKGGNKDKLNESVRQAMFSIMSRNGFLFNFSATFTDNTDIATCIYNYNLAQFVKNGYGKHIYISSSQVTAFRAQDAYTPRDKIKIVLKTFVLLTYTKLCKNEVNKTDISLYHNPLMLTLVNTVTAEDADLKMFFNEIANIAESFTYQEVLDDAKTEIVQEFGSHPQYKFESTNINFNIDVINSITYSDILKHVYNSDTAGKIEVRTIKDNSQELVFKLQTSSKPFGLIKIGETKDFIKNLSDRYAVTTDFDDESVFTHLNYPESTINLFMGSRAFYEGWDSNRPNIILFINIGVGKDAHKFVLQSVGRGVRVEPIPNIRRRAEKVLGSVITLDTYNSNKQNIDALESLSVFGTNSANVEEIIKSLEMEEPSIPLLDAFEVNVKTKDKPLLIPVFNKNGTLLTDKVEFKKFQIHTSDLEVAKNYTSIISDRILLVTFRCPISIIKKIRVAFADPEKYFDTSFEKRTGNPELIIHLIIKYYSLVSKDFESYREIGDDDIVHFKHISVTNPSLLEELKGKIKSIREYPKVFDDKYNQIVLDFGEDPTTLKEEIKKLSQECKSEETISDTKTSYSIKYIKEHYYIPTILRHLGSEEFLRHVINVESEMAFLEKLNASLSDTRWKQFDWWYFSKLDQYFDKVSIPYFNSKITDISEFYPDFIFWLKKDDDYIILFVDPKGTEYTEGIRKMKGFIDAFTNDKHPDSKYQYDGFQIIPKVLFYNENAATMPAYRENWFASISEFLDKINQI